MAAEPRARRVFGTLAPLVLLVACRDTNPDDPDPDVTPEALGLLATLRYDASPPPADPSNRVADDAAAVRLGHRLFFDRSLSGPLLDRDHDGSPPTLGLVGEPMRVACSDCHVPRSGFVDTRSNHQQISLGARWTQRRAQTLLDVAFMPFFNWDGRRDSIWSQAIGVFESEREQNASRLFVAQQMYRRHRAEYEAIFGPMPPLDDAARFPELEPARGGCDLTSTPAGPVLTCRGRPGDEAEFDAMSPEDRALVTEVAVSTAKAIAAYVRTLRCGPSRFDAWLDGDTAALGRDELRGALLFVGRAGCVACHSGPRLTDGGFHNVGLSPTPVAIDFTDFGDRGAATGVTALAGDPLSTAGDFSDGPGATPPPPGPELEGAFRTPTVRCLGRQPSFMHTGQLRTLEQVVAFFARGGDRSGYPGHSEIAPLDLDARDQADLVAFLRALDGPGPEEASLVPPP